MSSSIVTNTSRLRPIPSFLLPFTQTPKATQTRSIRIPRKTPFVPDKTTFLTLIGRDLKQHDSKIEGWRGLFCMTGKQLKAAGIEPPRARRYLLRWRERFRNGQYGIGGDIQHIKDGVAILRVAEVPASTPTVTTATTSPGMRKIIVNVPAEDTAEGSQTLGVPVKGLRIQGAYTITGPHVVPLKDGKGAKIVVKEGLWEDKRGRKIDGGERRQAEVRAKRRAEEKRNR